VLIPTVPLTGLLTTKRKATIPPKRSLHPRRSRLLVQSSRVLPRRLWACPLSRRRAFPRSLNRTLSHANGLSPLISLEIPTRISSSSPRENATTAPRILVRLFTTRMTSRKAGFRSLQKCKLSMPEMLPPAKPMVGCPTFRSTFGELHPIPGLYWDCVRKDRRLIYRPCFSS